MVVTYKARLEAMVDQATRIERTVLNAHDIAAIEWAHRRARPA